MSHETLKLNRKEKYDPNESEIVVSFKYSAGRPMTMYKRNGDPGDPAEPDEINILKIETEHGNDITDLITEEEFEYIETYLFENWQDTSADEYADIQYDRYREERDRE